MLNKKEIIELLTIPDASSLFKEADKIRKENVGDEVHLRGLIEFSNYCKNNCLYCGLRRNNINLTRYRIDIPEIISTAKHAKDIGLKTIVLQSGEDLWFTSARMSEVIKGIKDLGLALTLSIGEKSFEEYEAYKKAGADRVLIRIETTDKKLYADNNPNMDWDNRVRCLNDLKKLGFELGSGIIIGLPNQTIESYADDILFMKEIGIDMGGVGPFIPHPDTPLKDASGGTFDMALRIMAIMRLVMPKINIPATTAMETLKPNGQIIALQSGANVIMPNITLEQYRKHYQLYQGKPLTGIEVAYDKIKTIGRTISQNSGQSKNFNKEQ